MNKFYCPKESISDKQAVIKDHDLLHYLKDVLRLQEGEKVKLFDNSGYIYEAKMEKFEAGCASFALLSKTLYDEQGKIKVICACALPKKSKFDDIVDKLTQLGVQTIVPLITERVIVQWDDRRERKHLERWQEIALNSSQQCARPVLPNITPVTHFSELMDNLPASDVFLVPNLMDGAVSVQHIDFKGIKTVTYLIGPEGDFTPEEVDLAVTKGFQPVSLGQLVLRVETAAVALCAYLRFLR